MEKGRHLGLPREQRLCQVRSKIEDEEHFLFHCSKYKDYRSNYIVGLNIENLKNVFTEESKFTLLKLATFVSRFAYISVIYFIPIQ